MLEVEPSDARHMFWEKMKRLFYAMKGIEPEDLDEKIMNDFSGGHGWSLKRPRRQERH